MLDVALRAAGAATFTSHRLRSILFNQTEEIHSMFDVELSMFDVH
jgi:hypothetical protein